jgi:hypothetical protein
MEKGSPFNHSLFYEILDSHGGQDVDVGLLSCNACGLIPKFRRNILPSSSQYKILVLYVVTPCGLVDTKVSEEHSASIFSRLHSLAFRNKFLMNISLGVTKKSPFSLPTFKSPFFFVRVWAG